MKQFIGAELHSEADDFIRFIQQNIIKRKRNGEIMILRSVSFLVCMYNYFQCFLNYQLLLGSVIEAASVFTMFFYFIECFICVFENAVAWIWTVGECYADT